MYFTKSNIGGDKAKFGLKKNSNFTLLENALIY